MSEIIINNRLIGDGHPIFLIAEAGTSHQGSLTKAYELIDAAKEAGAHCVKFQYVIADELVHPSAGSFLLLGREVSIYHRFKELEQPLSFYKDLKEYCDKKDILFLCTPFGVESAKNLLTLNPAAIKIASPELTHLPLLDSFKDYRQPLLLSTGVSKIRDIRLALQHITAPFALLHCLTQYPANPLEANLNTIDFYRNRFNCVAGLSDHTEDPLLVPLIALNCGASLIEKHLTLSKEDSGLDDPFALTPLEMKKMANALKEFQPHSWKEQNKILIDTFGKKRVHKIKGRKCKTMTESEKKIYLTTNRSLIALKDIQQGEPFTPQNCGLLRSEHNIKPGVSSRFYEDTMKKKAAVFIPNGSGISSKMIGK